MADKNVIHGRRTVPGALIKFNERSDLQQLVEYMHSENEDFEMTETLELRMKQMEKCAALIRSFRSRLRVIPKIMKRFDMSRKVAYQLYADTLMIFSDKQGSERKFWVDILIGGVAESIKKATNAKNFSAVATLRKLEKEIIDDFFGDESADPYVDLQPAPVYIGFYPGETKVKLPKTFEKDLERIKKKKTKWLNQDDIEEANVIDDEIE